MEVMEQVSKVPGNQDRCGDSAQYLRTGHVTTLVTQHEACPSLRPNSPYDHSIRQKLQVN